MTQYYSQVTTSDGRLLVCLLQSHVLFRPFIDVRSRCNHKQFLKKKPGHHKQRQIPVLTAAAIFRATCRPYGMAVTNAFMFSPPLDCQKDPVAANRQAESTQTASGSAAAMAAYVCPATLPVITSDLSKMLHKSQATGGLRSSAY